jgi:hypothetical protein
MLARPSLASVVEFAEGTRAQQRLINYRYVLGLGLYTDWPDGRPAEAPEPVRPRVPSVLRGLGLR